jgi:hypothetical protein
MRTHDRSEHGHRASAALCFHPADTHTHTHVTTQNIIASVTFDWTGAPFVRRKSSSARCDSGSNKYKRGYGGACGKVWWNPCFSHSVQFIIKFYKFCTLNSICKDNAVINCITIQHKHIHYVQLWRITLRQFAHYLSFHIRSQTDAPKETGQRSCGSIPISFFSQIWKHLKLNLWLLYARHGVYISGL